MTGEGGKTRRIVPSEDALRVLEVFSASAQISFDRILAARALGEAERAIPGNDWQTWSRRLVEVGESLDLRIRCIESNLAEVLDVRASRNAPRDMHQRRGGRAAMGARGRSSWSSSTRRLDRTGQRRFLDQRATSAEAPQPGQQEGELSLGDRTASSGVRASAAECRTSRSRPSRVPWPHPSLDAFDRSHASREAGPVGDLDLFQFGRIAGPRVSRGRRGVGQYGRIRTLFAAGCGAGHPALHVSRFCRRPCEP